MIKSLYETHVQVTNLGAAISFYESLGLELLSRSGDRLAFMRIGERGQHQELGLWQTKKGEAVCSRHFAFEVELHSLMSAKPWLRERGIETVGVFGRSNEEPVVHPSGPIASVYFNDPDGNMLEFAARLPEKPRKLGYIPTLSEWRALHR